MITEEYVSFETAKLLKEKGYWNIATMLYKENGDIVNYNVPLNNKGFSSTLGVFYEAPTLQMTMKWLREVYNIIIDVSPLSFNTKGSESFICNNWVFTLWENGNPIVSEFYGNQTAYPTYEEACEAAIKYCLKNLI